MAKIKYKQHKTRKQAKPKFTKKTRMFDLVRKEYHPVLREFVKKISKFLKDCDPDDWKNLSMFDVDYTLCGERGKTEFIYKIAVFLHDIGKSDGLKCSFNVFCQYLTSTEHSNFGLKYGSVKTMIIRMINYIEECKKVR